MKLIGMISLPMTTIVSGRPGDEAYEAGRHVAFDQDGAAWLLVERFEAVTPNRLTIRITFARWHLLENLPVVREPPFALLLEKRTRLPDEEVARG